MAMLDDYRFEVDFGLPGVAPLVVDEPPPLGDGDGPNAARLLAAAVGNCLSASALFCLRRARVPVHGMSTTATATLDRNERGRMRVDTISVRIVVDVDEADRERMRRCLEIFEDYCVVTESVRGGLTVGVEVVADGGNTGPSSLPHAAG
jgi:uncharacterized OsmC-like protein